MPNVIERCQTCLREDCDGDDDCLRIGLHRWITRAQVLEVLLKDVEKERDELRSTINASMDLKTINALQEEVKKQRNLLGKLETMVRTGQISMAVQSSFRVGDKIRKLTIDFAFCGEVVAVFKKKSGEVQLVVEDDRGILSVLPESLDFNPGP